MWVVRRDLHVSIRGMKNRLRDFRRETSAFYTSWSTLYVHFRTNAQYQSNDLQVYSSACEKSGAVKKNLCQVPLVYVTWLNLKFWTLQFNQWSCQWSHAQLEVGLNKSLCIIHRVGMPQRWQATIVWGAAWESLEPAKLKRRLCLDVDHNETQSPYRCRSWCRWRDHMEIPENLDIYSRFVSVLCHEDPGLSLPTRLLCFHYERKGPNTRDAKGLKWQGELQ